MNRLLLFSIIILTAAVGFAKGPVKISGLVTDQENEPLEFVTVKVQGKPLGTTTASTAAIPSPAPKPIL